MDCTYRLSLGELLTRPAVELRLVGSDGENENGSETGSGNDDQNGSGNGSGDDDDKDKGDKGKTQDPKDKKIAALEDEKQRHYDLRLEAEAKLRDAEAKIAKLEKDGTTDEETRTKLVNLERDNDNLKTQIGDLRLENEFLKSNKYRWRSPKAALKLADLSKVTIDDKTGSVFGLEDALKALAEDSPFLLEETDDADDKGKDKDKGKGRRTGTPPADRGSQDDKSKQAEASRLRSKYPGLRR